MVRIRQRLPGLPAASRQRQQRVAPRSSSAHCGLKRRHSASGLSAIRSANPDAWRETYSSIHLIAQEVSAAAAARPEIHVKPLQHQEYTPARTRAAFTPPLTSRGPRLRPWSAVTSPGALPDLPARPPPAARRPGPPPRHPAAARSTLVRTQSCSSSSR